MSSKKTTAKKPDTDEVAGDNDATFESVEDDSPEADAPPSDATPRKSRKAGGGVLGWLALLFAFIAIAGVVFDFLRDRDAAGDSLEYDTAIASLDSSMRAIQDSVDSLQQNIQALSEQRARQDAAIDRIADDLSERLAQIEALRGRLSLVEGSVTSLQGISTGARDSWLLAEAEYYLQIANAQLQLAGNPQLAHHALRLADERILQLANPALTDVRRALSDELRSLELVEKPDIAGITLQLASLAEQADSLPLNMEISLPETGDEAVDPGLTGTDRALASLRNAFSNVVSVRRTDESLTPLIAPEAQYFLRANLSLQLQAARLAVLRGEETAFRQSLDDASAWLTEYYDTGSAGVQAALDAIAGMRDSAFSRNLPDISESLRLLRQYNALVEQRTAPVIESQDNAPAEPGQ
ncbi:MAG: uroporphyrinogen-III C-methyltransferase [Woeseiaceae bacterium]|nr:uroporphyrinogen-III C-methyltransferase [Woeseiaceae bacterium]